MNRLDINPFRLKTGGQIDRDRPIQFTFNGKQYTGFEGDTLASALLANGVRVLGRSFKFHPTFRDSSADRLLVYRISITLTIVISVHSYCGLSLFDWAAGGGAASALPAAGLRGAG